MFNIIVGITLLVFAVIEVVFPPINVNLLVGEIIIGLANVFIGIKGKLK